MKQIDFFQKFLIKIFKSIYLSKAKVLREAILEVNHGSDCKNFTAFGGLEKIFCVDHQSNSQGVCSGDSGELTNHRTDSLVKVI